MVTFSQTLRRVCCTVAVLLAANLLGGCAAWNSQHWSVDSLRDQRAVDLDQRLAKHRTIVENPFH